MSVPDAAVLSKIRYVPVPETDTPASLQRPLKAIPSAVNVLGTDAYLALLEIMTAPRLLPNKPEPL
jgi:hypothetical protein